MLFHTFGEQRNPSLMLVHGAHTTWQLSFSDAIPTLAARFHVIAIGVDGFDPEEDSDYVSAAVEAERIGAYIHHELNGKLDVLYGSSLGCHPASTPLSMIEWRSAPSSLTAPHTSIPASSPRSWRA